MHVIGNVISNAIYVIHIIQKYIKKFILTCNNI